MKHYLEIYKQKRFKINSENNMDVDGHNVQRQIRKGRQILLCDCENDSRFANINLCRHKTFFILFPYLDFLFKETDKLINEYKIGEAISNTEEGKLVNYQIINDLRKLRGEK